MRRVFVDTSAWLALVSSRDRHHARVRAHFDELDGRLVTSNFVVDEALTLCKARLGHAAAVRLGGALRDGEIVSVVRVESADETAAWELFVRRADQPYSFTDCTSFALMRRLGLTEALALDDDFRLEGFTLLGRLQ